MWFDASHQQLHCQQNSTPSHLSGTFSSFDHSHFDVARLEHLSQPLKEWRMPRWAVHFSYNQFSSQANRQSWGLLMESVSADECKHFKDICSEHSFNERDSLTEVFQSSTNRPTHFSIWLSIDKRGLNKFKVATAQLFQWSAEKKKKYHFIYQATTLFPSRV